MNLFYPYPMLIRRVVIDGNDIYYLKTTTYCDQYNYIVDNEVSVLNDIDVNGVVSVDINILKDDELPSNSGVLPLIHHVELGPLPDMEIQVAINLTIEHQDETTSEKEKKGVVTISTVHAEEESRPIQALM